MSAGLALGVSGRRALGPSLRPVAYNEKKSDMSYEKHVTFSRKVVRAAEGKGFDERVLDLEYWYRMRRRQRIAPQGARACGSILPFSGKREDSSTSGHDRNWSRR
jgi:hypothetical protein